MKLGIAVLMVVVIFAACLPVLSPATGKGTDYPCGIDGHTCSSESGGGCCDEQEICGHDHTNADQDPTDTCPVGDCCYVGPGADEAPPNLMMHRQTVRPQTPRQ